MADVSFDPEPRGHSEDRNGFGGMVQWDCVPAEWLDSIRQDTLDQVEHALSEWRKDPWNIRWGAAGFDGVIASVRSNE